MCDVLLVFFNPEVRSPTYVLLFFEEKIAYQRRKVLFSRPSDFYTHLPIGKILEV